MPYDVNTGAFRFTYKDQNDPYEVADHSTPPTTPTSDHFMKLPNELLFNIAKHLSSKTSQTYASTPAFRQLPVKFFGQLVLGELPWLYEARELPIGNTDWFKLWNKVQTRWKYLKGLKNRRWIWKVVHEVVNRIERYRKEGRIVDDWMTR